MKYQLKIDDALPSIIRKNSDKTPLKSCLKKGTRPVSLQGPVCIMSQVSEIMDIFDGD